MARKRSIFFCAVEPFLKPVLLWVRGLKFLSRRLYRWLILSLLVVLLSVGIPPVLSQIPAVSPMVLGIDAQQLLQKGKEYYEKEYFQDAANVLKQASDAFQTQGEELNQAITLSNLSLTYQQLGDWPEAEQAIKESLKLLQPAKNVGDRQQQMKAYAQSLDIEGRLYYLRGQPEVSLNSSQQATNIYQELANEDGIIGSLINQAQAWQSLGHYQQANETIESIKKTLEQPPESLVKVKGWRTLGNILRVNGNLEDSQNALKKSRKMAETLNSLPDINAALLSLGNTEWALGNRERERHDTTSEQNSLPWRCVIRRDIISVKTHYQEAIKNYQHIVKNYQKNKDNTLPIPIQSKAIFVQAKINLLNLLIQTESEINDDEPKIDISILPKARSTIYTRINLAKSLACLSLKQQKMVSPSFEEISNLLETSVKEAQDLSDRRAESYAVGNLAGLYEYFAWLDEQNNQKMKAQKWRKLAQDGTEKALILQQPIEAPDIAYQWQWQLGRLLEAQDKKDDALNAYRSVVNTLDLVRGDLLSTTSDVQFSFRDNIEPIYRHLVKLLLTEKRDGKIPQEHLKEAITNIDNLQLAELENFLQCKLKKTNLVENDKFNDREQTAIVNPIILDDRLSIILQLPKQNSEEQELVYHEYFINHNDVEKTIEHLSKSLINAGTKTSDINQYAGEVYEWIIKPIKQNLENNSQIKTLLFILDGSLRSLPMAVLYDKNSKKYLIEEKYDIAVTPKLKLFTPQPFQEELKVFLGGFGEAQIIDNDNFPAIQQLRKELDGIARQVPNSSQILDGDLFNKANIERILKSRYFNVIHLKTHGIFSSNPKETFIVANNKEKITGKDLAEIIQNSNQEESKNIQLLVLSACQTAKGDKRAVLGLAGTAIQSGVHSALSTLWTVDDSANTELMIKFYEELIKPGATKAVALHNAQKYLFERYKKKAHFWAAYILVGNWL